MAKNPKSPAVAENGINETEAQYSMNAGVNNFKEHNMPNQEDITGVELVDLIPTGDHRVIVDSFEKRVYDDSTYLDFQLIGLEGQALDRKIFLLVRYPADGKATCHCDLGMLIKVVNSEAKGEVNFENDLLQKEVMVRVGEDDVNLEVNAVWPVDQEPPISPTEDNG